MYRVRLYISRVTLPVPSPFYSSILADPGGFVRASQSRGVGVGVEEPHLRFIFWFVEALFSRTLDEVN